MINNKGVFDMLEACIPKGRENAIHLSELAKRMLVSEGQAKKMVQLARQNGALCIMSGAEGYWITEDEEEKKAFERMLRKQALTRLKTTKPIRDTFKSYKGQISLTDASQGGSEEVDGDEQK